MTAQDDSLPIELLNRELYSKILPLFVSWLEYMQTSFPLLERFLHCKGSQKEMNSFHSWYKNLSVLSFLKTTNHWTPFYLFSCHFLLLKCPYNCSHFSAETNCCVLLQSSYHYIPALDIACRRLSFILFSVLLSILMEKKYF